MKHKTLTVNLLLLILLVPIFGQAISFDYVPGSLIKDRLFGISNCIVEEGYYFLVIDNTGVVTDDYDRNDSYVLYLVEFSEDINTIEGSVTVAEGNYFVLSFNFKLTGVVVTECYIEIHGSNRVSVFITDYLGLAEYYEQVGKIDIDVRKQLIYTIVGVGCALAVGIGAATYFILRKIRRQERIIKDLLSGKVRKGEDEKQRNVA